MCGNWIHHAMAYGGSGGTWLDRWRAACRLNDVACLLALLEEDLESGKANMGTLAPGDVAEAARVACEAYAVELLKQVVGTVEEGVVCAQQGMFDKAFRSACGGGHVGMVRELLGVTGAAAVNVNAEAGGMPEAGFRRACANGHAGVVRELLALSGDREVDVHAGFSNGPEVGFRVACREGHVGVVRALLGLSGHREVDVHAGPEGKPDFGFRLACVNEHVRVLRELLGLTGHRAIPLQVRLAAGEVAVQPAKDAVWAGTSTRRGRCDMVLLRADTRR